MIDFGYSITKSNRLDLDKADVSLAQKIISQDKSFLQCIGCGTCTAGCTAGQFTPHNPRRIQIQVRNGQTEGLARYDEKMHALQENARCCARAG